MTYEHYGARATESVTGLAEAEEEVTRLEIRADAARGGARGVVAAAVGSAAAPGGGKSRAETAVGAAATGARKAEAEAADSAATPGAGAAETGTGAAGAGRVEAEKRVASDLTMR